MHLHASDPNLSSRELTLALLSEGNAPGRRGLARSEIERALRCAGRPVEDLDAELEALAADGLAFGRLGEWWATVLGHRAGRRVPLEPRAREAMRSAVRAALELALVRDREAHGPPPVIVLGRPLSARSARVILLTKLRLHFADLSREGQPGESLELIPSQADELVALGLARWPGTTVEAPS